MTIALGGCGLIGNKRASALAGARLVICADSQIARARSLASKVPGCAATDDWQRVLEREDVSAVVVATTNDALPVIARAAIEAGKHVLVEKPAARNADELKMLPPLARERGILVRVGFNHRYHRAFVRAQQIVNSGDLGELMFVRGRYGHGGRLGYEKEWRAQPELSGGGELIDQGVHLIDLARCFLGNFAEVNGYAHTYFWKMPVDDNAFLILKTVEKQIAFLHVSCTEWKNMFSFEIYGHKGKLQIDGLGGSYGVERLVWYKMLPEMGPPESTLWEYPQADNSWEVEMAEFMEDIRLGREPTAGLEDAIASLDIVNRIYRESGYDHRT